jgi:hypothetical protein
MRNKEEQVEKLYEMINEILAENYMITSNKFLAEQLVNKGVVVPVSEKEVIL